MVRLKNELAAAEHAWRAIATDFDARNPQSSDLLIASIIGMAVGFLSALFAGLVRVWPIMATGITILVMSFVAAWISGQKLAHIATRRKEKLRELWAPHCARIEWLKYQIEKNRVIVDA